ncbi:urease accessory protein UreD [Paenibacillus urinalis]|uniref:Urease accessory protein UreD n=1 Tax=Paenibacillus urinalis TaxID=521520 RepID=A0ABY7XFA5_9BACL|nr:MULTISPECIES: urease accessory protein UreD [Paenibacillus]WDH95314.1 urease accessory protein UreD [Paenibacillus urinalis]WDI03509.1 urease accessory protein UreD [Paenibacillus urinalis]GAK41033.1 hypothetical protein TCA2_3524 [Paenibacillus sp. TCA20]
MSMIMNTAITTPINLRSEERTDLYPSGMKRSELYATFERKGGLTYITDRYHTVPLRISRTFRLPGSDGELCVYTSDVSPGVMNGDEYDSKWLLKEGAHVVLTSTSATRLHPTPTLPSSVSHTFHLEQGAILEYFPECVIPFAGSRSVLTTAFHLGKNSTLVYADVWSAGRVHRGEQFDFIQFQGHTEVWKENELLVWDRFSLEPGLEQANNLSGMLDYTHMAALWIAGENISAKELTAIREALPQTGRILAGATLLAGGQGIAVRMLGRAAFELQEFCIELWNQIRPAVIGKVPLQFRK